MRKKSIMEELNSVSRQIGDLKKRIDDFENYTLWGFSFLAEVREVIGIDSPSNSKEKGKTQPKPHGDSA